jgi:hypothetical protein
VTKEPETLTMMCFPKHRPPTNISNHEPMTSHVRLCSMAD